MGGCVGIGTDTILCSSPGAATRGDCRVPGMNRQQDPGPRIRWDSRFAASSALSDCAHQHTISKDKYGLGCCWRPGAPRRGSPHSEDHPTRTRTGGQPRRYEPGSSPREPRRIHDHPQASAEPRFAAGPCTYTLVVQLEIPRPIVVCAQKSARIALRPSRPLGLCCVSGADAILRFSRDSDRGISSRNVGQLIMVRGPDCTLSKDVPVCFMGYCRVVGPSPSSAHERRRLVVPISTMGKANSVGFIIDAAPRTGRTRHSSRLPDNILFRIRCIWSLQQVVIRRSQGHNSLRQAILRLLECHLRWRVIRVLRPATTDDQLPIFEPS
mmetsp:Transcript_44199/g.99717  ORF Transcript_44199/g.99717 Transcript_44199/m.99717 type:complete len:325 (-) Transcript_44199:40-1014(-)